MLSESKVFRMLQSYRDQQGIIDLDAFLKSRGFESFLSRSGDFYYDNDAEEYGIVIFVGDAASAAASVKGLDEYRYHNFYIRSRSQPVRLKFWPSAAVEAVYEDWDNNPDDFCNDANAEFGDFYLPLGALVYIVNLATQHSAP